MKLQISRKRLSNIIEERGIQEGDDLSYLKNTSSRFGGYFYNGKVMSVPMIARETGHTNHTIYRRLKANGCSYGEDVTEICNDTKLNVRKFKYMGEALTVTQLSEKINRTTKYISAVLKKYNIEEGGDVTAVLAPGPIYTYFIYKVIRVTAYKAHILSGVSYKRILDALKSRNVKTGHNITRLINSISGGV